MLGWVPTYDLLLYPSTLDLYGLYTLACHTGHQATLPANITYEAYQGSGIYQSALPLPEFPYTLLLTLSCCTLGIVTLRLRGIRQHQEL